MEKLFLKIAEMSLHAGFVIVVILIARLLLKKAPRKWSYLLWGAAAFRLCCPFAISSAFSVFRLIPKGFSGLLASEAGALSAQAAGKPLPSLAPTAAPAFSMPTPNAGMLELTPEKLTSAPITPVHAAQLMTQAPAGTPVPNAIEAAGSIANAGGGGAQTALSAPELFTRIAAIIWLIGIAALLVYALIGYIGLKRKLIGAMKCDKNRVYLSDEVDSPFILGIFRPRIYIPFGLSDEEKEYVLAHEENHIKRADHIVKAFAFAVLCVHWFNPLCWLAFVLMSRDLEMSCDEKVLSQRSGIKKAYSRTLLSFAVEREFPKPNPLAFGESGVKGRIKNTMKYKKPKMMISIIAAVITLCVLVACVANPRESGEKAGEQQNAGSTPTSVIETDAGSSKALSDFARSILFVPAGEGEAQVTVDIDGESGKCAAPEDFYLMDEYAYILNSADENECVLVYSLADGSFVRSYNRNRANANYTNIAAGDKLVYLLDAAGGLIDEIDIETRFRSSYPAGDPSADYPLAEHTVRMFIDKNCALFSLDNEKCVICYPVVGKCEECESANGYIYKTETLGRITAPLFTIFDHRTGNVIKTELSIGETAVPLDVREDGTVFFLARLGQSAVIRRMNVSGEITHESERFTVSERFVPHGFVRVFDGAQAEHYSAEHAYVLDVSETGVDIREVKLNAIGNEERKLSVEFADPAFEAEYRRTRPADADPVITEEELLGITSLSFGFGMDGSFPEITDISDAAKFKNLESFMLNLHHGARLESIEPLSELKSLRVLWLYDCGVNDISPLGGLTGLQQLILGGSDVRMESLAALENLTELRYLMLENCGITDVSVLEPLKKLENADLCGNAISSLKNFPNLPELETLTLDDNRIDSIEALCEEGMLPKLRILSLGNNLLSSVSSLARLSSLEQLILSGNRLDEEQVLALSQMLPNCEIGFQSDDEAGDFWSVDLDGNGADEKFLVNIAKLKSEFRAIPCLIGENGENLGAIDMFSYSHAANNNYILTEKDGVGKCIMVYTPAFAGGGRCEYSYKLYTVHNGALICAEERSVDFCVYDSMPGPANDIDAVLAFVDEVNALLEKGTLLISSDAIYGLTKYGLYDRETGEHIDTSGYECVINMNGLTINSRLPAAPGSNGLINSVSLPYCMFTERGLLCRESLAVIDFMLDAHEDFPRTGDLREKLEYANYLLECSRAIVAAGEYNGISCYDGVHIVKESIAADGTRSYLVYVPSSLMPFDESAALNRIYVLVHGDSVIGAYPDGGIADLDEAVRAIEIAREYLIGIGYTEAASDPSLSIYRIIEYADGSLRYIISSNNSALFVRVEHGRVISSSPDLGTVEDLLRLNYPEYFGIRDGKGLEVYVFGSDENSLTAMLLPGTNRLKTEEDFSGLTPVSLAEMKIILSTYDTARGDINVYMPIQLEHMRKQIESMLFH